MFFVTAYRNLWKFSMPAFNWTPPTHTHTHTQANENQAAAVSWQWHIRKLLCPWRLACAKVEKFPKEKHHQNTRQKMGELQKSHNKNLRFFLFFAAGVCVCLSLLEAKCYVGALGMAKFGNQGFSPRWCFPSVKWGMDSESPCSWVTVQGHHVTNLGLDWAHEANYQQVKSVTIHRNNNTEH